MTLRTAAINVHPPRATRWAKAWRRTLMARFLRSARKSARSMEHQWGLNTNAPLPSPGLIVRLVVPGWAQIHDGQTQLGRGIMTAYCVFVLVAIVCFGSSICSFVAGLAFACHGISVYDVARRSSPNVRDRILRSLLGCGMLAAIVYLPAWSMATRFVDPIVIQHDRFPLLSGDVLLIRRSNGGRTAPRIGSIVQYQIQGGSVAGRTAMGNAARYEIGGARIDRVLAGPGQAIDWDGHRLRVDGQFSPVLPLNPAGASQPLSFTLPADSWLILPSTEFINAQAVVPPETWEMWCTVRTDQIEGRVIWRSWPWSRIGIVDD